MLVKLHDFAKQGSWLKWDELMELDLSWKNLIYCFPPKLVSFYLGAVGQTLPTPDNLLLWGNKSLGNCSLCASPTCTILHILAACPFSLRQGRYTWRHDSRRLSPPPNYSSEIFSSASFFSCSFFPLCP